MRILVLTLILSFLSHSVFASEGKKKRKRVDTAEEAERFVKNTLNLSYVCEQHPPTCPNCQDQLGKNLEVERCSVCNVVSVALSCKRCDHNLCMSCKELSSAQVAALAVRLGTLLPQEEERIRVCSILALSQFGISLTWERFFFGNLIFFKEHPDFNCDLGD
jgi:hypothetical protein